MLLAALAVGLALAFWPTLASFPGSWEDPYGHGWIVGGIVLWLVWRHSPSIAARAGRREPLLLPPLAGLSLLWVAGMVMDTAVVHQGLLVVILVGWGLAVFGGAAARPILAIGATALLAVPFWGVLTPVLQRATVIVCGAVTRAAGIEAEIGRFTIAVPAGTFIVEEACSGLAFLLAGLSLGAAYGHLFTARWQTQLKIVALAGAVSIVGNWIRVSTLIFIGAAQGLDSPIVADHGWLGWWIFVILMMVAYALARRIEHRDELRAAGGGAGAGDDGETAGAPPRDGSGGPGHTGVGALDPGTLRWAVLVSLVAVIGPITYAAVGALPRSEPVRPGLPDLALGPEWQATDIAPTAVWLPDYRGVDERAAWRLSDGGAPVEVVRHLYREQHQGKELIQWGNRIAPDSLLIEERVIGPIGPTGRIVRQAAVRTDDGARLVWYWYRVAGADTAQPTKAKVLELLAFARRHPGAELITLSAPCGAADCREAARALLSVSGAGEPADRS